MTDIEQQLRAYFDEVDPPFDVAGLMREPEPSLVPTRSWVPSGLVAAAVAAVVVVVAVGLPLLASGGRSGSAVEPTLTTVPLVTTTPSTAPTVTTMPESNTDPLLCPSDPTSWSRSEPLPAMVADPKLPDAALTTASGTAVAVGIDTDRNVEAYWSHDGVEWSPAEGFPEAKVVGESPPAVAGGDAGFVAVVVPDIYPDLAPLEHPDTTPIVAYSEDGIAWDVLDPGTLPHGVLWLSDVYAGPAGFLITGAITTDVVEVGIGAFVWASPDGRNWSVADYPVHSWPYPTVVATDTGWAANTSTGSYIAPTEIWRSTDGVNWYETPTQNAPPEHVLADEFKALPTALLGDTWVIRGPTVWTSTNEGATWDQYPIGDDQPPVLHSTGDIATTPLGFLMTTRYDFGEDHSNLLHYSTDGTRWQLCATPRIDPDSAADFTEIAVLGDTVIVLDSETGIFATWNEPSPEGGLP